MRDEAEAGVPQPTPTWAYWAAYLSILVLSLAPAPFRAPPPPPAVKPGAYSMLWRGTDCRPTHFYRGGTFYCKWNGSDWEGKWKMKGTTLHVDEWRVGNPELRCSWDVYLRTDAEGEMSGGSEWKLRPLKGRVD